MLPGPLILFEESLFHVVWSPCAAPRRGFDAMAGSDGFLNRFQFSVNYSCCGIAIVARMTDTFLSQPFRRKEKKSC
jgi:hypothetical protein